MNRPLLVLLGMIITGPAFAGPEELLSEAKLAMFDGRWEEALERLRRLRTLAPSDSTLAGSYFYEAKALEKLHRHEESLRSYEYYLRRSDRDSALVSEARASVIRLSVTLYRNGHKQYLDRVTAALSDPDRELALLAALQISRLPEDSVRRRAIPVLQRELQESRDAEVRNQASLALLRIDPRLLESGAGKGGRSQAPAGRSLRLVFRGADGVELRLNLPLSLARLLLSSLPESAREDLRREGIEPENLVEELSKAGEILEVQTSEGRIRIWID
jgi:tetratricopeptide (TPR) repeat protein